MRYELKASARAHPNIALVKYWGKRDPALFLPVTGSLGITISNLNTHSTVAFDSRLKKDEIRLNGHTLDDQSESYKNISGYLDLVRSRVSCDLYSRLESVSNFPIAAGLASSASGFAALACTLNQALRIDLSERDLSILARLGSGSACRSCIGGFVEWLPGSSCSGEDSFATQILPETEWNDLRILVCKTSLSSKKISSRVGMELSAKSSLYFKSWCESVPKDLEQMRAAIVSRDFTKLGELSEANCMRFHALLFSTVPALVYWNESTLRIIELTSKLRKLGLKVYFTIDAGPQVKLLTLKSELSNLRPELEQENINYTICELGSGTRSCEDHLF